VYNCTLKNLQKTASRVVCLRSKGNLVFSLLVHSSNAQTPDTETCCCLPHRRHIGWRGRHQMLTLLCVSIPPSASNDDENDAQDRRGTAKTAKKSCTHAIGNLWRVKYCLAPFNSWAPPLKKLRHWGGGSGRAHPPPPYDRHLWLERVYLVQSAK